MPRPTPWVQLLEDNTGTRGMHVQRLYPGIRPADGARKENDRHNHLETFQIRCGGSRHVALVHIRVVLGQSVWLRDEVARRESREALIRIPDRIRWWQVAWALEFMYEGRIPGFSIMAGEEMPAGHLQRRSRPIAWGFLQLWDAAEFFGLRELQRRAEQAFMIYFDEGMRHCILDHRGAFAVGPGEGVVEAEIRSNRSATRFVDEFFLVTWKAFVRYPFTRLLYAQAFHSGDAWLCVERGQGVQGESAIEAWENTMFDTAGAPDDEESLFLDPVPPSAAAFRPLLVDMCMSFAERGLFELVWFQIFVSGRGPAAFREALALRMSLPDSAWPREEYPGAPFSFERVDPWILVASNARAVPPQNAQQG